jgi:hypothetical protein
MKAVPSRTHQFSEEAFAANTRAWMASVARAEFAGA